MSARTQTPGPLNRSPPPDPPTHACGEQQFPGLHNELTPKIEPTTFGLLVQVFGYWIVLCQN